MRSRSSQRLATLEVEGLEERRVMSALGLGVGSLIHDAGAAVGHVSVGHVLDAISDSAAQSAAAIFSPTVPPIVVNFTGAIQPVTAPPRPAAGPDAVLMPLNQPTVTGANPVVEPVIAAANPLVETSTPISVAAAVPSVAASVTNVSSSSGATSVLDGATASAVAQHARASTTLAGVNETGVLTGVPGSIAANYASASASAVQPVAWVANVVEAGNRQSAPLDRDFFGLASSRDDAVSPRREGAREASTWFIANVNDDTPGDSQLVHMSPQEVGLLTSGPADAPSLDVALQQFLSRLNDVGSDLSQTLTESGWLPWVLGAALTGLATLELTRRRSQRRMQQSRTVREEGDLLSWIPGIPGSLGFDEA
jgi:hypothetical protein